jgi:uncharacterized protein
MARLQLSTNQNEFLDFSLSLPQKNHTPETLVVYVHGFASHQKGEKVLYFKDRFLSMGTAYLAFDHRGHGSSSGTMKELTLTRNLEDLDTLLNAKGANFKRRILIGSSMGGQTAAWYAATHPDQITANFLIAPGFRFIQNRLRELGPDGLKKLSAEGQITVKNEWVEITIGKELLDDGQLYPLEKLLKHYHTPTLILHGTDDRAVPFEDSVTFVQESLARPMELVLIAGGDHRLSDHKQVLFAHMETFCKNAGIL